MKKIIYLIISMILTVISIMAQPPQAIKYQAVARNSSGNLLQNQLVAFRISILQGGPSGTLVYQERHTPTTNNYGLVNLEIGKGAILLGTFSNIDWGADIMYLKVEFDPAGGTSYLDMGTSEMLSVPYTLSTGTSGGWQLTGNSGTSPTNHFIGTTDNVPLTIRVNNQKSGNIDHLLNNTSLGYKALDLNTTGNSNVAVGTRALYNNTNRSNLVAFGDSALFYNGLGATQAWHATNNTAVGSKALISNNTGFCNTAIGNQALKNNTNGSNNSACGNWALYSNTTGYFNTAIGDWALEGNTTGSRNTGIGTNALSFNTTGYYNTAIGNEALYSNTEGTENTATGYRSLNSNTTGSYNTAGGFEALKSNIDGYSNTADGYNALNSNIDGYGNTASGYYALNSTTSGFANSAFGYLAGVTNETGFVNTFIGSFADPIEVGLSNTTALGFDAMVWASNQVVIGNSNVTSIGGYTGWSNFSDGRLKKNIREDVPGLEFIKRLRPITYSLDVTSLNTDMNKNRSASFNEDHKQWIESPEYKASIEAKEKIVYTGFIAQEVEATAHSIGYNFSGVDAPQNIEGYYGIRYAEFVVPLVKAVQEQQAMIEKQQAMIEILQDEIEAMKDNK